MKKLLMTGILFSLASVTFAALSPFYQSARELKVILTEVQSNLSDTEILNALSSSGGKVVFQKDTLGYKLTTTTDYPCVLRIEVIYSGIDTTRPMFGPLPFTVKRNVADDVACL